MATVTTFQFAIGDGVTTAFTLLDPSGETAINPVVSSLYRTDWGGRQLLYTTARTNLAILSNIPSSWGVTAITIPVTPVTAPNGSNEARKMVENTANTAHFSSVTVTVVSGQVYTTSVYAKAGERSILQILENVAVTARAYFNLATGQVMTVTGTGSPSARMRLVDGGYYRCELTYTAGAGTTSAARVGMATADNTPTYLGDGASGLYVWGLMSNLGSSATSLIPTAGAPVTVTDYSVAGSTATLATAPVDRALLDWTGTDDNGPFIPGRGGMAPALSFGDFGSLGAR